MAMVTNTVIVRAGKKVNEPIFCLLYLLSLTAKPGKLRQCSQAMGVRYISTIQK